MHALRVPLVVDLFDGHIFLLWWLTTINPTWTLHARQLQMGTTMPDNIPSPDRLPEQQYDYSDWADTLACQLWMSDTAEALIAGEPVHDKYIWGCEAMWLYDHVAHLAGQRDVPRELMDAVNAWCEFVDGAVKAALAGEVPDKTALVAALRPLAEAAAAVMAEHYYDDVVSKEVVL